MKNILVVIGIVVVALATWFFFSPNSFPTSLPTSLPNLLTNPGKIDWELMADGFTSPVKLVESPDGSGRLFVAEQIGLVKIIKDGQVMNEPFLDLREKMTDLQESYDERGLLGIAFSPNFKEDGKFYVYYSAPLRNGAPAGWNHTSHISEFKVSGENPDKIDLSSEKVILEIDEPQLNHNGGDIVFGLDGHLYIGVGDGGNADDFGLGHSDTGNGQDLNTLLGKILRIKPDGSIPADNPFVGKTGEDEIWAYGFRNPFRISFDKDGRLFVADVGQNLWEEVNIVEKGKNYGWNIKEGTYCFSHESANESPAECANTGYLGEELVGPIFEYNHNQGISVMGGFVYRGSQMEGWQGKYVFGDWSKSFEEGGGKVLVAEEKNDSWSITETKEVGSFVMGFGEDSEGELYLLTSDTPGLNSNTGKIYKIMAN